jgi:phosphonate transport system substrate-binding protein
MPLETLVLGAVAYDPKVVTIWEGFRRWLVAEGMVFDFVLYSNYERQVEDLIQGRIDVAWNSPLAWVRARRMGQAANKPVRAISMRDSDRDLTSVVIVRADSGIESIGDLRGRTIGTGAVDSPQATLLPLSLLRHGGVDPDVDVKVRRFDMGVGLHGDHIGGEREAARALVAGEVDAACLIDGNLLLFGREGTISAGSTRVIAQTPPYDHCNMTVGADAPSSLVERFDQLLSAMRYDDPVMRPLLDLEGLKQWEPGRISGYEQLERAVDEAMFYDAQGHVTAADYRP